MSRFTYPNDLPMTSTNLYFGFSSAYLHETTAATPAYVLQYIIKPTGYKNFEEQHSL